MDPSRSLADEAGTITVPPMDEHNRELVENVHPPAWVNPQPSGRYHLVAIGAGTAGLVSSAASAGLGARAALIEKHLMGGDCLNVGCVPSKCLIRASRAVADARDGAAFGVSINGDVDVDFPAIMERMRRIRSRISHHDSASRFRDLGVDVYLGAARFTGPRTIEVDGRTIRFNKAVITTGARAARLPIQGLEEAGYLTNETVFSLTELPARLAVIGGGPIGCELAQAFRRFGAKVTLFQDKPHILEREDGDAAEIVQRRFVEEGIELALEARIDRVVAESGARTIHYTVGGRQKRVEVDEILVGAGRAPNVDGLGLDEAGVNYDKYGVSVDDNLRTSNRRIFAAGDICMRWKFTHAADFAARIVIQNALFPFLPKKRLSALTMPWCTYTDPEVAHVGMYEHDAAERGIAIDTIVKPLAEVDRALADGEEDGFVKIHVRKGKGHIVGATIVARHAGEMISELTLAMVNKIKLGKISNVIHPYPTQAEAIRAAADLYNKGRVTPMVRKVFGWWFGMTR